MLAFVATALCVLKKCNTPKEPEVSKREEKRDIPVIVSMTQRVYLMIYVFVKYLVTPAPLVLSTATEDTAETSGSQLLLDRMLTLGPQRTCYRAMTVLPGEHPCSSAHAVAVPPGRTRSRLWFVSLLPFPDLTQRHPQGPMS